MRKDVLLQSAVLSPTFLGDESPAKSMKADHCFVTPEVTVTNDNRVGGCAERFKHFARVKLERDTHIGANAGCPPRIEIGRDALVSATSVVIRPIGSPALLVREAPPERRLETATEAITVYEEK